MAELIVVFLLFAPGVGYYWYVVHICVSEPKNSVPMSFCRCLMGVYAR